MAAGSQTQWDQAVQRVTPYMFNISTPKGAGTGWIVGMSRTSDFCAIATAAHVIDHARQWEFPIRLRHADSDRGVLLQHSDCRFHVDDRSDTAAIILERAVLPIGIDDAEKYESWMQGVPQLIQQGAPLLPGAEIGWLGYPAVVSRDPHICFFSGRVSSYDLRSRQYLVDGVAINGVSGGPAFCLRGSELEGIGVVTAYIPNLAAPSSGALPGVAAVQDVSEFYSIVQEFRNLDESSS